MTLDADGISNMIESMDREANSIRNDSIKLSWYMRGGANYSEVMNMSYAERNMISELVKENMETTKKTGLNFF